MPREPSSPRIAVWRRLKALGVVSIGDGVVGLPADARTREQLGWFADRVVEANGEATLWIARATSARQERELAGRMSDAVAAAYESVLFEADEAARSGVGSQRT